MRYTEFEQVFDLSLKSPYDRKTCQDIEATRSNFDGMPFIDRVLKALGMTKGTYQDNRDSLVRSCTADRGSLL